MRANIRRAVAPVEGVKAGLRYRSPRERRGVKGSPRPVLWGDPVRPYAGLWRFAVAWTAFMVACALVGTWRAL